MAAGEEGVVLGDGLGEVQQWGASRGRPRQHQHLRAVVLDVGLGALQVQRCLKRADVGLCRQGIAPVHVCGGR